MGEGTGEGGTALSPAPSTEGPALIMTKESHCGMKESIHKGGERILLSCILISKMFQFSSVAQSCPALSDFMPDLPVHHQLPESTQTHVHCVGDAIQPSHPLSSPSPPALNLSQHQGLFQWVSSPHQMAKVLEFQLQHRFETLGFTKKYFKNSNLLFSSFSNNYFSCCCKEDCFGSIFPL